ncbi:hypothetical protein GCM10009532_03120 [Microbacterium aurantiacum]
MDGVGTSVVGRPRRLSADRRSRPTYTLIWEEPAKDFTLEACVSGRRMPGASVSEGAPADYMIYVIGHRQSRGVRFPEQRIRTNAHHNITGENYRISVIGHPGRKLSRRAR